MNIGVVGSPRWSDRPTVYEALDSIAAHVYNDIAILAGRPIGVGLFASEWAYENEFRFVEYSNNQYIVVDAHMLLVFQLEGSHDEQKNVDFARVSNVPTLIWRQ